MISGDSDKSSTDFELNLAPIIDCLTVLITFMLASITFLSVGILELALPRNEAPPPGAKPPAVTIEIELGNEQEFRVKVSGKRKLDRSFPAVNGTWDLVGLEAFGTQLRQEFPGVESVVISAKDDVAYAHYIRTMDTMKHVFPVTLMGGVE